jgi:hypothetical protein
VKTSEARFLSDGISGFSQSISGEVVDTLKQRTESLEARRLQDLTLAFVCGGISLVALFLVYRVAAKFVSRPTKLDVERATENPQVAIE